MVASTLLVLASAQPAEATLGRVVALGDSLASGTNLGPRVPGSILACGQSTGSYPELAHTRLAPSSWANATCNGGHSGLFEYGWGGLPAAPEWLQENDGTPIPPQFSSIQGNEQAVIVGTGGNEAYFGQVIGACLGHVPSLDAYNAGQPPINNCTDTYVQPNGYNTLRDKVANSEAMVGPGLDALHARAPNAKVFLVGLPRVARADGVGCMPNPILTLADAPVYAVWEDELRLAMKRIAAARSSYVRYVDMQAISGSAHTMCAAWGQKWFNPWSVEPGLSYPGMTVHNTPAGANAIANAVIDQFKAAGLDTGSVAVNPVVNITSPTNNKTVTSASVSVSYSANDNVGVDHCDRANGSSVPLSPGANTIVVTCFDNAGNPGSGSVNVFLADSTKPVVTITSPAANQSFTTQSATVNYTATDNIGVTSCTRANGSSVALVPGVNTISVTCSDGSGNSATASVNVTYTDVTKPTVSIDSPGPNQAFTTQSIPVNFTASDNVGIASCTRVNGASTTLVPGSNTITVTCSDIAGNQASASVSVTYADVTKPTVTIDSPTAGQTLTTQSIPVNFTASDNVGIASCTRVNGASATLVPGSNTISVSCSDDAGNTSSASVSVTYTDVTKPVVTISSPSANQSFTTQSATLTYTATDNVGVASCDRTSGSSVALVPGGNSISVTCSDAAGNSATASVNVTYTDVTKPTVSIDSPSAGQALTTQSIPVNFTASDNVGIASCTRVNGASATLVPGSNTISVTCSDAAGNEASASVSVTYTDVTKPTVSIDSPTAGQTLTTQSIPVNFTASDNVGVTSCTRVNGASATLVPGSNTISVSCTDAAGNEANASVSVTYTDATKPVVTITSPAPDQSYASPIATLTYTATDNVGVTECSLPSGSSMPLVTGGNLLAVTCSDAAGNSATASVLVSYNDTIDPVLTIESPADGASLTTQSITLSYTATDNVAVTSCTRENGSLVTLTPGSNTIAVTCFDAAGNSASASLTVTYTDTTAPIVTIDSPTADQVLTTEQATLSFTASDNVGVESCTRENGSTLDLVPGPNTFSVSCSDAAGNTSGASVTVTYTDVTKPVVTITSPEADQAFTTQSTAVTYTATDNVGVASCDQESGASVPLVPGSNTVTVTCSDDAGNSTTASVTVTYTDVTKPVVTIDSPTAGQSFSTPSAALTFRATDNVGIVSCTRENGSALELAPGPNTISVSCSDAAGNTSIATVVVTRSVPPAQPPKLAVSAVSPRSISPTRKGSAFSLKRQKGGGSFRVKLDVADTALVRLERIANGKSRAATRWTRFKLASGSTRIRLTGRVSRSRRLKAGSYRVHVRAGGADAFSSAFRIKR